LVANNYPFAVGKLAASALDAAVLLGYNLASTRVGCRLRRVANQSITNITGTSITWDTEDEDTDGFIAVPSTTITIPTGKDGTYTITHRGAIASLAPANARTFTSINFGGTLATGTPAFFRYEWAHSETVFSFSVPGIYLNAGATVGFDLFYTDAGGPRNYTGWVQLIRTGP